MSLSFTQKRDLAESVVFLFVALVLFTGLWVTRSYFEARTYSRLTGASVSTWDALWVEFRVQEGVK
jgi:hypothetical protein